MNDQARTLFNIPQKKLTHDGIYIYKFIQYNFFLKSIFYKCLFILFVGKKNTTSRPIFNFVFFL